MQATGLSVRLIANLDMILCYGILSRWRVIRTRATWRISRLPPQNIAENRRVYFSRA
jgi:hypothetical protein